MMPVVARIQLAWLRSAATVVAMAIVTSAAVGQSPPEPAAPATAPTVDSEAGKIRDQLDEILADPEFRRLRLKRAEENAELPQWLQDLIDWLSNFFGDLRSFFSALGIGIQALAWTVLMLAVGLIVYLIARVIANYQRSQAARQVAGQMFEQGELLAAPGELAADVYLQRALALAAAGRYREAIGLLLLGLMSHAERAGLIRHRRGLTHRDYLRAVRGQASLQQSFRQVVAVYEPICFGRREARSEHFESSLVEYHAGLKNA